MQEGAHCPPCWMKICALFIPKEMKLEHSALLKNLTDEQLDLYKLRSYEVTSTLLNIISPLPNPVLPQ